MLSLQSVLLEHADGSLAVTACNLMLQIRESIEARGEPGAPLLLPITRLLATVGELPAGTIRIAEAKANRAALRMGSANVEIPGSKPDEFNRLTHTPTTAFGIPQSVLKRILRQTVPFVATSNDSMSFDRPVSTGVSFQSRESNGRAVAFGGPRMATVDVLEMAEIGEKVIPASSASALIGLLGDDDTPATVEFSQSFMAVTFGSTAFTAKLIDGKMPDLAPILDKVPTAKVQIGREELQSNLRLMRVSLDQTMNPATTFEFNVNSLKVSTAAPASVEIAVKYSGDPFTFKLNHNYVLDVLGVLDTDDIQIEYIDSLSPIFFRAGDFFGAISALDPKSPKKPF